MNDKLKSVVKNDEVDHLFWLQSAIYFSSIYYLPSAEPFTIKKCKTCAKLKREYVLRKQRPLY